MTPSCRRPAACSPRGRSRPTCPVVIITLVHLLIVGRPPMPSIDGRRPGFSPSTRTVHRAHDRARQRWRTASHRLGAAAQRQVRVQPTASERTSPTSVTGDRSGAIRAEAPANRRHPPKDSRDPAHMLGRLPDHDVDAPTRACTEADGWSHKITTSECSESKDTSRKFHGPSPCGDAGRRTPCALPPQRRLPRRSRETARSRTRVRRRRRCRQDRSGRGPSIRRFAPAGPGWRAHDACVPDVTCANRRDRTLRQSQRPRETRSATRMCCSPRVPALIATRAGGPSRTPLARRCWRSGPGPATSRRRRLDRPPPGRPPS